MARRIVQTYLIDIGPPADWTLEEGITQSLLSNYLCCPMRGLLKLNRWGHPSKVQSTRFGSAFHEILDIAYTAQRILSHEELTEELQRFMDSSGNYTSKELEQKEEDKAVLHAVIRNYFQHYREDFTKKDFRRVEKSWEVPFAGATLRGKIDGEFTDRKGAIWLMEHKTKSRIDEETLMQQLSFDFQNLMYITMYEMATGKKVRGTLYNVVRRPGLRQGAGETLKSFADRVTADVAARPDHYFKRMEVVYSPRDKADFKSELVVILTELRNRVERGKDAFYKNRFACMLPFKCEFLEACAAGHLGGYVQADTLFPELAEGKEEKKRPKKIVKKKRK